MPVILSLYPTFKTHHSQDYTMVELQDYIKSLDRLPLADKIKAIADLIPGLKAQPPKEYEYLVKHPDYEGIGNLTDLAVLWIDCARKCHTEHAPFQLRLIHQSMDDPIYQVYDASRDLLMKAVNDGTIIYPAADENADCSCCNPDARILEQCHVRLALTFDEEEYLSLWGDDENRVGTFGLGPEGESICISRVATREQVERALRKSKTPTGDVKGQTETTGL